MNPVVETTRGRVRGAVVGGTAIFKGIPYAAAPFGDLRFAAPEPAPKWDDVRDAAEFGPTAPKAAYGAPFDRFFEDPAIPGENPLNLNVWTPGVDASLPVLVWIHGGAFVRGSSAVPLYDGANFARDGVVFVSINYRLGAEGFALLSGAPANRGLLDQVAALEWVRDNIAAFGGNPEAVTIVGESAGGMSVGSLLAMPSAEGLFRRAIAQSGAGHSVMSADTARKVSGALAEALDVEPTRAGLSTIDRDKLVEAQEALVARIRGESDPAVWGEIPTHAMAFEPCIDGTVLPELPIDRIAAGVSSDVDVLVGHNGDEMTLFLVPTGIADAVDDKMLPALVAPYGLTESAASTPTARPDRKRRPVRCSCMWCATGCIGFRSSASPRRALRSTLPRTCIASIGSRPSTTVGSARRTRWTSASFSTTSASGGTVRWRVRILRRILPSGCIRPG